MAEPVCQPELTISQLNPALGLWSPATLDWRIRLQSFGGALAAKRRAIRHAALVAVLAFSMTPALAAADLLSEAQCPDPGLATATPATNWGLLANPEFDHAPLKGTYFFAGNWRNGAPWYGGALLANNEKYTVYPAEAGHLGWSESDDNRDLALNTMTAAGVNVVVMSSWGTRGTPFWERYAPMATSPVAHDELFAAATDKHVLIMPAIESYRTPTDPGFVLGDDLARYVENATSLPRPAAHDNSLLGQIEDLVNRYVYCLTHVMSYRCESAWPSKWAQLYNRHGEPRYAINLLFTCANAPLRNGDLRRALDGLAQKVYEDTEVWVGFTLDPHDVRGEFCNGAYLPTAASAAAELGCSDSFLAIQPYRDEIHSSGDKTSDADRIRRKRAFIDAWVSTDPMLPVILDVTPGYDAHRLYDPQHGVYPDPAYGNNDTWRNYQSQLKGNGVRGITLNAWNGFTEGWAAMPNCGGSWGPPCGAGESRSGYNWLIDTFSTDPRDCNNWQYVDGVATHHVYGAICEKWYAQLGSLGPLGDAVSSERDATYTPGARRTDFQHGYIFWSAETDAHEVHGIIASTYALNEFDYTLGLPVSDEVESDEFCAGGKKNFFQWGTIDWCPGWASGYVRFY